MERAGRATWTVEPRGSGERVGRRTSSNLSMFCLPIPLLAQASFSTPPGRDIRPLGEDRSRPAPQASCHVEQNCQSGSDRDISNYFAALFILSEPAA